MKLEKWTTKALKRMLVGYNNHTIDRIYIKDQKNIIWVKNLYIFKNYKIKASSKFFDYNESKLKFQGFLKIIIK